MFWLALLALAVIGFGKPRKWLMKSLSGANEGVLKILVFLGIFIFFVFGLIGVGIKLDLVVALLLAFVVWLGVLAGVELGQRRIGDTEDTYDAHIEKSKATGQPFSQSPPSKADLKLQRDPWGVLAARQKSAEDELESAQDQALRANLPIPSAVWPLANLLQIPVSKTKPEPEDAGLVTFHPHELTAPQAPSFEPRPAASAEPTAVRTELVNVLAGHAAAVEPAEDEEPAPSEDAAEDSTAESAAHAEPPELPAEAEAEAAAVEPEVVKEKDPLQAEALPQQPGKYKYEPKLVKSLFTKEEKK